MSGTEMANHTSINIGFFGKNSINQTD